MKQKQSYEQWFAAVDAACLAKCGLSIHDLEDQPFRAWYDDGKTAQAAAAATIRYSQEG